ncbi:DUF4129 domain-containing protein [Actinopolymorpha sp. B17G11]|uniref:DUF4129 domain-containing protein n=1 Tax=Actinopolymorpha sp. B17G11 TaxID=3160861 RepID=UPI0032E36ECE
MPQVLGGIVERSLAAPDPPIDIGRDDAARAAREELGKSIYHRDEPGVVSRVLGWLFEHAAQLLGYLAEMSPGGSWGLLALAALVVLAVIIIRWRIGAVARSASVSANTVFAGRVRSAAEHRAAADAAAGRGDYAAACRERFRALVRELEERTILDPRPGRTADEVAREVSVLAPEAAGELGAAAQVFDEVSYGDRRAAAEDDAAIRQADDLARRIRGRGALAGRAGVG